MDCFKENKYSCHKMMKFPEKLWNIVNECTSGAISWNSTGDGILLNYEKFKEEFLKGDIAVFKTCNVASFIRQLNLYGFRKSNRFHEEPHEFINPFFIRNRKDLLYNIHRRSSEINISTSVKKYKTRKEKLYEKFKKQQLSALSSVLPFNEERKTSAKEHHNNEKHLSEHNDNKRSLSEQLNKEKDKNTRIIPKCSTPNASSSCFSYIENGWKPADAEFYNSLKQEVENSIENDNKENECCKEDSEPKKLNNTGNMYFFVLPGYAFQHNPHMFTTQCLFNNMLPISSGLPMHFGAPVNGIVGSEVRSNQNNKD